MDILAFDDAQGSVLPREVTILISDTLECSATFVLTHLLSRAWKEQDRSAIFVGVSSPLSRYTAICRKAGLHLDNAAIRPRFRFVNALELLAAPYEGEASDSTVLHGIYSRIKDALANLSKTQACPSIFVDDLMSLLWSGAATPAALLQFVRALQVLLKQHSGTLVLLAHADSTFAHSSVAADARERLDSTDDAFLRDLLRMTGIWIQTRSLGSQTVGELVVHRGASLGDRLPSLRTSTRAQPIQFKLEDSGPKLFAKGLAKEYL